MDNLRDLFIISLKTFYQRLMNNYLYSLMTKDEFVNTVTKMYKSEVAWRKLVKNQTGIDQLWVDLIGPVGSKEWLNNDFDLIDDMLCKQIHNQHRIAKHKR